MNANPQFTNLELMTLKVLVKAHAERWESLAPALIEGESLATKAIVLNELAERFALLAKFED